ncbi:MAG TPA: hypothetical protein VGR26_01125 [Acidimicrobiales bacterium]|nr:hypothetical protein [Acidimicrobiales bacterium]
MLRRPSLLVLSLAATVVVADTAFEPADVAIETGEAVEWSFEDHLPHDVASDGGEPAPS